MTKVDRALELQVIDWLQWNEFKDSMVTPSDADKAQLALELIAKRKAENTHLRQLLSEAREALNLRKQHDEDCADSTEKFKPHEMCECGASVVKDLLTKLNETLGE